MYEPNMDLERSKSLPCEVETDVEREKLDMRKYAVGSTAFLQGTRSPWVRASQLPELFCSWDLAYRCTRGGWLRPIVQGKRRTIYRLADVLACLRRIEAGELPLPRSSKTAAQ